ncbi:galactose-1-phosphate uridylyltransferase [Novipirellula rosea]|uniref:Galactose-1-phosphate uridylyltransferase n=1 Tax=Novipirellula rosea TaxID=1031540 RepID=A0ABP8MGS9_9BACT
MIENAPSRVADRNKKLVRLQRRGGASAKPAAPEAATQLPEPSGCAESRLNPITGDWTIFAPHREARPDQFGTEQRVPTTTALECPFCAGEEHTTPPPTWVAKITPDDSFQVLYPPSNGSAVSPAALRDWSVRVVPNKFPAVTQSDSTPAQNDLPKRSSPLFQSSKVIGGHEVIIESPNHVQSISELDLTEIKLMLVAYQHRLSHWRKQPGIQYISLFKNVGGDAGASLQHSHSQLLASDQMPNSVENINERMRSHQARTGCCLQCDIIRAELKQKKRIVAQTNSLVAYCPYASRLPMLLRVTTKDHVDHFDQLSFDVLDDLARMIKRMTGWLETLVPNASYNMLLHTRPPGAHGNAEAFHWSLEFFPRITRVAGFEWSSQCMINTVLPELATEKYRKCAAAENPRLVL